MKKIMLIKDAQSITKNAQKQINGGNFPIYLCGFNDEGRACVALDGQIGQCNSIGVCEC